MVDTVIFIIALQVLIGLLAGAALYYRRSARLLKRQVAVMAAELADAREAHAAAVSVVEVLVDENAKVRSNRPLILNGVLYLAYKPMPAGIYKN